jgi:hypothetical protein
MHLVLMASKERVYNESTVPDDRMLIRPELQIS